MSAARVVLWRHGQTAWNAESRWQGQLDVDLDDAGLAQAEAAAALLALRAPSALVSSDLARARRTAEALARATGLAVEHDADLREMDAGAWQGLLRSEVEAGDGEAFAAWTRGDDVAAGGTGERRSQMAARVARAVQRHGEACPDGGTAVLVSHGAAVRAGVLRLLGLPADAPLATLGNCRWAVLEPARSGGWRLVEWNVGPHGGREGAEV